MLICQAGTFVADTGQVCRVSSFQLVHRVFWIACGDPLFCKGMEQCTDLEPEGSGGRICRYSSLSDCVYCDISYRLKCALIVSVVAV